jgi:hypothetical protein
MKFSLISLIALALTSTSVIAQPVASITATVALAVENRALDSVKAIILQDVPKGRKSPQNTATDGLYKQGSTITIICFTDKGTPMLGNP